MVSSTKGINLHIPIELHKQITEYVEGLKEKVSKADAINQLIALGLEYVTNKKKGRLQFKR